MAKKAMDPAKAKAAKQKKIAIGGGALLLVIMAIEVPMMMKRLHHPSTTPVAEAATVATPTPGAPATTDPLAPPTLDGTPTVAAPAPTTPTGLVADPQTPAGPGQLAAFSRFETKDPFAPANAPTSSTVPGKPKTPTVPTPPTPPKQPSGGTTTPPAPPVPPPTSAVISVNDQPESVAVGGDFPAANPMFHLVSLTETTAKIAIAGGSYANGSATLTLHVKKPVTLQNTADGSRFTIELLPQGTAASTPCSTAPATTAPAATLPATTTSAGP
jgi:hypothetical protein